MKKSRGRDEEGEGWMKKWRRKGEAPSGTV
jgi:hypothetical protein